MESTELVRGVLSVAYESEISQVTISASVAMFASARKARSQRYAQHAVLTLCTFALETFCSRL